MKTLKGWYYYRKSKVTVKINPERVTWFSWGATSFDDPAFVRIRILRIAVFSGFSLLPFPREGRDGLVFEYQDKKVLNRTRTIGTHAEEIEPQPIYWCYRSAQAPALPLKREGSILINDMDALLFMWWFKKNPNPERVTWSYLAITSFDDPAVVWIRILRILGFAGFQIELSPLGLVPTFRR